MSIFDAIKITGHLEDAVLATLELWFPVYKKELELQDPVLNVDDLLLPAMYLRANELNEPDATSFPALVCVCPGMSPRSRPMQEGDGSFRTFWSIAVGVFVAADNRPHTMDLVRIYTALARTIILQQQALGGYADGTTWLDESYDDTFPFADGETISAGQVVFEVEVDGVVNRYGGPAVFGGPEPAPDPATQPGSSWPTVQTITPTVTTKG